MNWGMRRPSIEGPCQEETGWPLGKMVVVVVVVVVAVVVVVVVPWQHLSGLQSGVQ